MRDATRAETGSRHSDGTDSPWHRWQIGPAGVMLYPTCTQLLIVQLPATGARGLSHGVLLNSDHPSWVWLPNALEGAGGGGHPTCPVGSMPTNPRGQKGISRQRSICQAGVSAACRGSLPCWHSPSQTRQALSATMAMAEAFQSPSACFNYCCVLAVNSSSSLFSDCQFLVLTNTFQAGGMDEEEEFYDSF